MILIFDENTFMWHPKYILKKIIFDHFYFFLWFLEVRGAQHYHTSWKKTEYKIKNRFLRKPKIVRKTCKQLWHTLKIFLQSVSLLNVRVGGSIFFLWVTILCVWREIMYNNLKRDLIPIFDTWSSMLLFLDFVKILRFFIHFSMSHSRK